MNACEDIKPDDVGDTQTEQGKMLSSENSACSITEDNQTLKLNNIASESITLENLNVNLSDLDDKLPILTPIRGDFENVLHMQRQLPKIVQQKCAQPGDIVQQAQPVENPAVSTKPAILMKASSCCNKSRLLVRLNRIKTEDANLMQQSIEEFIKKSPELAKKMCLLKPEGSEDVKKELEEVLSTEIHQNANSINEKVVAVEDNKSAILNDTFNIMKASEKISQKRKHPTGIEDIPTEEICK